MFKAAFGLVIDAKFLFNETVRALLRRIVIMRISSQVLFTYRGLIMFIRVHIK